MGFFTNIFKRNNPKAESRPAIAGDFIPISTSRFSIDGTSFACIDRIASEFAQLGYGVYDRKTRQKVTRNSIYQLLSQPNLEEDSFLFLYNSAVDYFNGGCYWLMSKDADGYVVSLFRLNPSRVDKVRDVKSNRRIFIYNNHQYTDEEILYIPARYNYSTLKGGQSIFKAADGTFETATKLERYTKSAFDNGINGSRLVIDISQALPDATPEQMQELKSKFAAEYAGIENAGRPILKKKGIEYSEIGKGTDNRSAELVENRQLQKQDVAMLFGVPLELLSADSSKVDTEKAFLMLCEFAVKPLATQFQQAINRMLNSNSVFFEFDFNNVLKTSISQRVDAYTKQIGTGLLSLNEARRKENLPEIEAGDTNFMPANMMPWNEEIKEAYMAKQKQIVQEGENNSPDTSTDEGVLNSQHSPNGDDKN